MNETQLSNTTIHRVQSQQNQNGHPHDGCPLSACASFVAHVADSAIVYDTLNGVSVPMENARHEYMHVGQLMGLGSASPPLRLHCMLRRSGALLTVAKSAEPPGPAH